MQKEPQGSQAASKGPAQGMMLGLVGCVYGSFLHGFGHPAPGMEQQQQHSPSFALQAAQAGLPTQGLGMVTPDPPQG